MGTRTFDIAMPLASALAIAVAVATGAPASAGESPCHDPLVGSPLLVSRPPGNLGTIPDACPGTGASLVSGAALLVDRPQFYGALWAGSGLAGRAQVSDSLWISAVVPGLEYRFVANAVVEAEHTGLGAGSLGAHGSYAVSRTAAVAPFVRAVLPTETVYRHARRYGGEAGTAATWRPSPLPVELTGGIAVPVLVTVNGPYREVLVQPVASGDAFWHAHRALSLGAGAAVRANLASDRDRFEAVELRGGLRTRPWRRAVAELAVAAPRHGRDRTDLAVTLSIGWAFQRPRSPR